MKITLNVPEGELAEAVAAARDFKKFYHNIKPFQRVIMDDKWQVWNTKTGSVSVKKK